MRARTPSQGYALVQVIVLALVAASAMAQQDQMPSLIRDLQAGGPARRKALEALVEMGPQAAPAVQGLIAVLDDPEEINRDYAITTLTHIGPAAAPALPALRRHAQNDPSEEIRQLAAAAVETLGAAGGGEPAPGDQPAPPQVPPPPVIPNAPQPQPMQPPPPPAQPPLAVPANVPDLFSGGYRGDNLTLILAADPGRPGAYSGTVGAGDKSYPLTAQSTGNALAGSFTSGGSSFAFTASVQGNSALRFESGGNTYNLQRTGAAPAQNPPAPAPAPAQGRAGAAPPAGFSLVARSDAGQALVSSQPGVRSAQAALLSGLRGIANSFDERPTVSNAFVDQQDRRAGAPFRAKFQGQAVRGIVLAGISPHGCTISVIFAREDADPRSLSLLAAALPAPPRETQWKSAGIPDGSGTVRIPEDWRMLSGSKGMCTVIGPESQAVELGIAIPACTPELAAARRKMINDMHLPPQEIFEGRPEDPARAFLGMTPTLSNACVKLGLPAFRLVKALDVRPVPNDQNWPTAFIDYLMDINEARGPVRQRALAMVICLPPMPNGEWLLHYSQAHAPVPIFERDLPMMIQIMAGWNVSDAEVHRRLSEAAASMRATGEILQRAREEKAAHEAARRAQQQQAGRDYADPNADFDEAIRGWRTVEDTLTGERKQVDLGNVDIIVQEMNEHEGWARFRGIPLRNDWPGN